MELTAPQWAKSVPLGTAAIAAASTGVTVVCLAGRGLVVGFVNIPALTFRQLEIHRIVTAPLVHSSGLALLLILLSYISVASRAEREQGTVAHCGRFAVNSEGYADVAVQLVFSAFAFTLEMLAQGLYPYSQTLACFSLWPLVLCEVTVNCLHNPSAQRK